MLSAIGVSSLDGLFEQIPSTVRLEGPLGLPEGVSELEIVEELGRLASRSRHLDDLVCFAGAGAYDHYIPSAVWALAARSEFSTAYTPYQPELSQGILQALFEFQSMVCELTDLEVSNASLYDGATALVEAVNMSRTADRPRVLVSEGVDPRLTETLRTYGRGSGYEPEVFPGEGGRGGSPEVGDDVAAVIVQHPNVLGILEPASELFAAAREGGARAIQVFDPLSLGVLAPPGQLGADIAVAEGQSLGNHLAFGGPYLGLIAARMSDVRRMPGRIVGETVDVDGAPGYVLTLQAREQHIRREKANSNICTNQTLMAIAATIYLGWLGPEGLRRAGPAVRGEGLVRRGEARGAPRGVSPSSRRPVLQGIRSSGPGRCRSCGREAGGARLPGRRRLLPGGRGRTARRGHGAEDAGADRRARDRHGDGAGA